MTSSCWLSVSNPIIFVRRLMIPPCLCVCVSTPNFFVFYAVRVMSKKRMRLILPTTSCVYSKHFKQYIQPGVSRKAVRHILSHLWYRVVLYNVTMVLKEPVASIFQDGCVFYPKAGSSILLRRVQSTYKAKRCRNSDDLETSRTRKPYILTKSSFISIHSN
jgi:hypothetical protein